MSIIDWKQVYPKGIPKHRWAGVLGAVTATVFKGGLLAVGFIAVAKLWGVA